MFRTMLDSAVVLYHYPCIDGAFAALAAQLHLKDHSRRCRFIPHRVYEKLNIKDLGLGPSDTVFLCDYVGPQGFAHEVASLVKRVVILDHHKTAREAIASDQPLDNLEVNLDMQRSGATMALDYFQPQGLTEEQQLMFKMVEDADLWRWKLENSKEFHAGMIDYGMDKFDAAADPGVFDTLLNLAPDSVIAKGRKVLAEQNRKVAEIVAASFTVQLGGLEGASQGWGTSLAVRADSAPQLRSQIGNMLAAKSREQGLRAMGVVIYVEPAMQDASKLKVSLRSIGEEDTTVISSAFGGGGHKNASSFIADAAKVEAWRT